MSQNLNVGDRIENSIDQQQNSTIEKYCFSNNDLMCDTLGGLYHWEEAMQYQTGEAEQGICPTGWHLPTDDEFKELDGTVDSQYNVSDPIWDTEGSRGFDAGKHMKSETGWKNNGNGDDLYAFHGYPAGFAMSAGFFDRTESLFLWTSTVGPESTAYSHWLLWDRNDVTRIKLNISLGFSVRCLMNDN